MKSWLECIACAAKIPLSDLIYHCPNCGSLLDVRHDFREFSAELLRAKFEQRLGALEHPYRSGVWRYQELVWPELDPDAIISHPEGNTNLYPSADLRDGIKVKDLWFKHEGENPTGSFKDRGMTGVVTHARYVNASRLACASTGNTAASLAAYAARAQLPCWVFVHGGGISESKQAQMLDYGAKVLQMDSDFDSNLESVRELADSGEVYLANSLNPVRLEGQKTIIFETLQQLGWRVPDWILVSGGNLGNVSAFGKALVELHSLRMIGKLPRLAVIQAAGANPFYQSYRRGFASLEVKPAQTIASAIRIGNPINFPKAVRSICDTDGVVEQVEDGEILDARSLLGKNGIGCEPASAATLAGLIKLRKAGVIQESDSVVCVLTGHGLKDVRTSIAYHLGELSEFAGNYTNRPVKVAGDLKAIRKVLGRQQSQ